ncbi:MAG: saccharopine dehydrogenase NADP-binding domain-containing protein [Rhodocyclaceae bacterium]|nr:saccharopine dehydrogenase NADP-binding domain-containing protein [Rhodocyclaceae bacterium]
MSTKVTRKFDVVIFGATGFTGGLTAEYLARWGGENLRWALAGRNLDKLAAVRQRLVKINPACSTLELLQADVADAAAILRVAESAKVVITTVGPYLNFGEPLVAACAAAGTDYVDLTGEPEFVDSMWLKYHAQAVKSGARIVNCCGFDSIPHDLGVLFTVQQLPENVPLKIEGFVRAGGKFSGGTFHSAITAMSRMREGSKIAKQRRELDQLPIGRKIASTREKIHYDSYFKSWAVPMPTIDPQIVRRSAAANDRYGPDFRYGHFMLLKHLPQVGGLLAAVSGMFVGAQFSLTRNRLLAMISPGEGPDEARRAKSWFKVRFIGEGGGQRVVTEVASGDPGYGETSKMLAESALCLAFDSLPKHGGVLTPAQAMGDKLLARLQAKDISFSVISE